MWELFAAERSVETETGQAYRISYYILAEEVVAADHVLCENYGVRIVTAGKSGVQSESMRRITLCLSKVNQLVQMMATYLVTPSTLRDIVENWIAAG